MDGEEARDAAEATSVTAGTTHTLSPPAEPGGMVRTASRRVLLPTRNLLEEFGDMVLLTGEDARPRRCEPPYPYGGELVSQFLFTLRLVWFPLLLTTVAIDYGAPGLQAANFLTLFGALDRLGGLLRARRDPRNRAADHRDRDRRASPGTAITADLGARKIREELDALQVLGVDPVKNLVVPRFLALMIATGLFDIYALLFGIFGGLLAEIGSGGRSDRSGPRCSPTPRSPTCGARC